MFFHISLKTRKISLKEVLGKIYLTFWSL